MTETFEMIRQFIFFTSILSGFSFAVVVELISKAKHKVLTAWIIVLLTIAALLMLSSTFIGSLLLVKLSPFTTPEQIPVALRELLGKIGVLSFFLLAGGLTTFMAGFGLAGWLYSRIVGIITSVTATLIFIIMVWVFVVVFPA